jgi:hypothetical protein
METRTHTGRITLAQNLSAFPGASIMMATTPRFRWTLIAVLVMTPVSFAAPTPAPPKGDDPDAKTEPPALKLRKAYDQTVSVDFQGLTLAAALEALREQTKVNFVLDRATASQMGVVADEMPVSLKLTNVRLRTVLKQLLNQYNLSCVIDQDIVLVTSEQAAIERQVRQRVSIDFDKVPFQQALRQLSRETNTNLVIDPRHATKINEAITLRLDDVPLEIAVRLMSEMAGLRSVRQANVLFITTKEIAADLRREEESSGTPTPPMPSILERGLFGGGGGGVPAIPAVPGAGPAPAVPGGNPLPAKPAEDKEKDKEKDK